MTGVWLTSASVLVLYACGSSEEDIGKLGDDIEKYAYYEEKMEKFEYDFTGCEADVIRFIRENRSSMNPFETRGRLKARVFLSKLDARKVEVIRDYVVAPCSRNTKDCLVDSRGMQGSMRRVIDVGTDAQFIMRVHAGRADDVARWLTALINACK